MQIDIWDIGNYFWCRKESFIDFIFLQHAEENIKMIKNSHIKEMAKELLNNLKIYFRTKNKIGNLIQNYKKITTNSKLMANKKVTTNKKMTTNSKIMANKKMTTTKKITTNNKIMASKKMTTNKKITTNNKIITNMKTTKKNNSNKKLLPTKQNDQQKNYGQQKNYEECFIDFIFLQNAEENIQIMKNSYIKERAKALLNNLKNKDFRTKNKIGNLYLIKNENFIISTSGAIKTYIGFSQDGTLVAVQCGCKNQKNVLYFTNEFNNLNNSKLESKNIIKYVSTEEDRNHIYIAVKLWNYYLDEYIENLYQSEIDRQKNDDQLKKYFKKIVEEMLLGLQELHQAGVIHGDINPRNIIIDSKDNVRLIGFGRNIKLEEGETTANTDRAGIQKNDYTKSSDIKAAGMLVYYIHSGGKHPFGVIKYCDTKNDVQDIVARDLIDWMINNDPAIDQVLKHPYFWNPKRKKEVLRKVGDQPEVQYYTDISKACKIWKAEEGLTGKEAVERAFIDRKNKNDQKRKTKILGMLGETEDVQNKNFSEMFLKLCNSAESHSEGKTFSTWKSVLSDKLPDIDPTCPEDLLGLLRTYRNKLTHVRGFDEQMFDHFPDFFISLHRLATDVGWDCTWS